MNSDQGTIKDAAGKVQRKAGEAVGSPKQQVKGTPKQAEGKAPKALGDTKDGAGHTGLRLVRPL